ncbi:MAG: c-type cytochrome [Proteobacteria bacterium]|nr:c-type cytochrome [Pseudomonadota bacterium]
MGRRRRGRRRPGRPEEASQARNGSGRPCRAQASGFAALRNARAAAAVKNVQAARPGKLISGAVETGGGRIAVRCIGLAVISALALAACSPKPPEPPPPALAWAYPVGPKAPLPEPVAGTFTVPGSAIRLTSGQVSDDRNPPDWFSGEHPPAPDVVAHGRKGGPTPCAECHLINGQGFLGAPNLAGLPAAYIKAQVLAFRGGERKSAEPGRPATGEMIEVAKAVTDPELDQAAAYFATLPRGPWFRVVEADTAPATRPNYYGWLDRMPGAPPEPLGDRIVEVAEDWSRMILADPHSGVADYVPRGAIARGEALVRTGGPGGQPCRSCHGPDLKGGPIAPPLAGRSAAYLARMLWDIKVGARGGAQIAPMKGPTKDLTATQITDVSAYLVSLSP